MISTTCVAVTRYDVHDLEYLLRAHMSDTIGEHGYAVLHGIDMCWATTLRVNNHLSCGIEDPQSLDG